MTEREIRKITSIVMSATKEVGWDHEYIDEAVLSAGYLPLRRDLYSPTRRVRGLVTVAAVAVSEEQALLIQMKYEDRRNPITSLVYRADIDPSNLPDT